MGVLLRSLSRSEPIPMTVMNFQPTDPRTGQPSGPAQAESTPAEIDFAVAQAASAADAFARSSPGERARLLQKIADGLEVHRGELVPLADRETALGVVRLEGELDRTTFQLRGFAAQLASGKLALFVDDPGAQGKPPAGRPRLTRVAVPVGPVAMFAASNFPFAFSVAGGDTASALAVGCPVVVKAHPGHPELSRRTAGIVANAVAACGLPAGVFQLVQGASIDVGVRLVRAPAIAAVAFTGSFGGGTALAKVATERPRPIPFYGELGSINPLVLLPGVPEAEATRLAAELAGSICLGSGQFCTSPGVVIVFKGVAGDAFVQQLGAALSGKALHAMLNPNIRRAFDQGVKAWRANGKIRIVAEGLLEQAPGDAMSAPSPVLAEVDFADFVAQPELREEVFGSAALVVRVASHADVEDALRAVGGSLTVTLWGVPRGDVSPDDETLKVVRASMQVGGRVLFSGVPTGVAISAAQHHGGPFPASTAPFTTSVGYAAAERFVRPLALQDAPEWLIGRSGSPV